MYVTIDRSNIGLNEYIISCAVYALSMPTFLVFSLFWLPEALAFDNRFSTAFLPCLGGMISLFMWNWYAHQKNKELDFSGEWKTETRKIRKFAWTGVVVSYFTIQPVTFFAAGILLAVYSFELWFPFRKDKRLNTFKVSDWSLEELIAARNSMVKGENRANTILVNEIEAAIKRHKNGTLIDNDKSEN